MTFKELLILFKEENKNLEKAIEQRDFNVAAKLDKSIAILKNVMEDKRPMSRKALEKNIAELQEHIKDALLRKAYNECASLQKKVDELTMKRSFYPNLGELRETI